jgi:hypothetical protein
LTSYPYDRIKVDDVVGVGTGLDPYPVGICTANPLRFPILVSIDFLAIFYEERAGYLNGRSRS